MQALFLWFFTKFRILIFKKSVSRMPCNNQILRKFLNPACYLGHLMCFLQNLQNKGESQPISRVLSRTIIHLQPVSPLPFSGLPESNASYIEGFLFGLAPGGVYQATSCYQSRGALLPHHFTLTQLLVSNQAVYFLLHCRGFAPPRCYLAPCSMEPGLSSTCFLG